MIGLSLPDNYSSVHKACLLRGLAEAGGSLRFRVQGYQNLRPESYAETHKGNITHYEIEHLREPMF